MRFAKGLISGLIAESIALPVLAAVIFLGHPHTHWWYLGGAIACVFVSVVYLAFFTAITGGKANVASQANVGFVIVCLALAALGLIELGTSTCMASSPRR